MSAFDDEVYVPDETRDGHNLLCETLLKEGKEGVYNQGSADDVRLELWTGGLRRSFRIGEGRRAYEFIELLYQDVLLTNAEKGETR